jgi:hypothetical protein
VLSRGESVTDTSADDDVITERRGGHYTDDACVLIVKN